MMFTPKEKTLLNQLLASAIEKDKVLTLDGVHGYLFGLAIIPEMIVPSKWLPGMFGEEMLDIGDDEDKGQRLMQGLFQIYNRIMAEEDDGKLSFPFDLGGITAKDVSRMRHWAEGFYRALNLRPEIWGMEASGRLHAAGGEEDEIDSCLAVIMGVAFPDMIPELFDENPDMDEKKREATLFSLLPVAVESLRDHAAAAGKGMAAPGSYKQPAQSQPRKSEKIGRNDPCPCGSGSKYKKCCGK